MASVKMMKDYEYDFAIAEELKNLVERTTMKKEDVPQKPKMTKEQMMKASLTEYERDLLELADEMASAMSDLNSHNYKNFIYARDKIRDKIKEMCDQTMANHEKVERMKKVIAEI